MLTVNERELSKAIDTGSHIVDLKGDANESALIKDVQWDAFGIKVLHLDLTRVDADEKVEVTLPIELKGEAAGTRQGGTLNFYQQELTILCPANLLPEKLEIKIAELKIDQSISASEVELPTGAELAEAGTTPIVSCSISGAAETKEEETEDGATEPEVIGKKDEE